MKPDIETNKERVLNSVAHTMPPMKTAIALNALLSGPGRIFANSAVDELSRSHNREIEVIEVTRSNRSCE